MARLTALLAVVSLLALSAPAPAQDKAPLRWGADAEGGAPYIFPDPKNPKRNIGFEVDLAEALARVLDRKLVFHQRAFVKLIDDIKRGDIDIAMNGLEITPDRQEQVLFSRPYFGFKLQLVVRKAEDRFSTLAELKQLPGVVGTLEDTAASRYLDRRKIKKRIYEGQVEPYKDLVDEVVDAVLLDVPIVEYYAKESMVTKPAPPLRLAGPPLGGGSYGIALPRNNPALKKELDAALAQLIENGELRRIYRKWNIWSDEQEPWLRDSTILRDEEQLEEEEEAGFLSLLLPAAGLTVQLTFLSFAVAMALGLVVATLRLYAPLPLQWLAMVYVEFFRGIPVLLLLIFLYYGLPEIAKAYALPVSLKLDPFLVAILGFGMNYAAYEAEIYRAGIGAVAPGQWEAAASLGMPSVTTFRRIIFPQAMRVILPPMTNDLVALFKDTSVVSVIALVELSKQYQILTKSSSEQLVQISLTTAALYLVMSVPLGLLSRYLEQRWGKGIGT